MPSAIDLHDLTKGSRWNRASSLLSSDASRETVRRDGRLSRDHCRDQASGECSPFRRRLMPFVALLVKSPGLTRGGCVAAEACSLAWCACES